MIRLNRTTEYGLMALRHMSQKPDHAVVTSAREVSDHYGIPFEITAKTLQRLKDTGLIQSAQGARGGYTLMRPLGEIRLGDFLGLMEGQQAVVTCAETSSEQNGKEGCGCVYAAKCGMSPMMTDLNSRIHEFLNSIRLDELTGTVSRGLAGALVPEQEPLRMQARGAK